MSVQARWAIIAVLADGRNAYWCAPGSRRGGQDQWSPRESQALCYSTRAEAEQVITTFTFSPAVSRYEVVGCRS